MLISLTLANDQLEAQIHNTFITIVINVLRICASSYTKMHGQQNIKQKIDLSCYEA
jgi:hypothetical protein